jgi:putative PLP-dependent aminotransferase (TIGR04422 family)
MAGQNYFLWPEPRISQFMKSCFRSSTASEIELKLTELFPGGSPVFMSSARAGICLTLSHLNLSRSDVVALFPYASHCVIEAVGRVAAPAPAKYQNEVAARLVYHQWGYVQQQKANQNTIEDAVDSLCRPGASLFPAGGNYEIWSLPKILGTLFGGVVWCRNYEDALKLRITRDLTSSGGWGLRVLGRKWPSMHALWAGTEAGRGKLVECATGEINSAIFNWQKIVHNRDEKFMLFERFLPEWLDIESDRLPCVVPIEVDDKITEEVKLLGVNAGIRHFERVDINGGRELIRVLPLPIHQDVPLQVCHQMRELLDA